MQHQPQLLLPWNAPEVELPLQEAFLKQWETRHCYEGTLVYGGTGSGKTSGTGRELALRLLRQGFGGLVLTAKNDEARRWIELCKEIGRENDIILFSHTNNTSFNFIDYAKKTTTGIDLVSNCFFTINTFIKNVNNRKGGSRQNEAFWQDQQDKMIESLIQFLHYAGKRVSIKSIYHLIEEVNKRRGSDDDRPKIKKGDAKSPSIFEVLLKRIRPSHPEKASKLENWLGEITKLSPVTYSCVLASVTGALQPLTGELLEQKLTDQTNVTPDDILFKNKIVIIDYDVKRFQTQGRIVNLIWKESLQNQSEATANQLGRNPAFLWMDEGQNFITENDHSFLTTARSAGVATVFLTQNLPNILAEFENHTRAEAYRSIFQTIFFHQNPCPRTNTYMEEQILPPPTVKGRCLRRRTYDLKTGGEPDYLTEAIAFHKGKTLSPTGERYLKFCFPQRRELKSPQEIPPEPTIWLITTSQSVGAEDFKRALPHGNPLANPRIHELKFPTFVGEGEINHEGVSRLLESLNPKPQDILCLVRGGGDQNQFAPFESEKTLRMLEELRAKGIRIVTGLGHACDTYMCDEIANYAETTPSTAGFRAGKLLEINWVIKDENKRDSDPSKENLNVDQGEDLYENNEVLENQTTEITEKDEKGMEVYEDEDVDDALEELLKSKQNLKDIVEEQSLKWTDQLLQERDESMVKIQCMAGDLRLRLSLCSKIFETLQTGIPEDIKLHPEIKNLRQEELETISKYLLKESHRVAITGDKVVWGGVSWQSLQRGKIKSIKVAMPDWASLLLEVEDFINRTINEIKARKECNPEDHLPKDLEDPDAEKIRQFNFLESLLSSCTKIVLTKTRESSSPDEIFWEIVGTPRIQFLEESFKRLVTIKMLTHKLSKEPYLDLRFFPDITLDKDLEDCLKQIGDILRPCEPAPDRSQQRKEIQQNFQRIYNPTMVAIQFRANAASHISERCVKFTPDPILKKLSEFKNPVGRLTELLEKLEGTPPRIVGFSNWLKSPKTKPKIAGYFVCTQKKMDFDKIINSVASLYSKIEEGKWEELPGEEYLAKIKNTKDFLTAIEETNGVFITRGSPEVECLRILLEEHGDYILETDRDNWNTRKREIMRLWDGIVS